MTTKELIKKSTDDVHIDDVYVEPTNTLYIRKHNIWRRIFCTIGLHKYVSVGIQEAHNGFSLLSIREVKFCKRCQKIKYIPLVIGDYSIYKNENLDWRPTLEQLEDQYFLKKR